MAHDMSHAHQAEILPPDPAKIKKIWMTALLLGVVTGIEFVFAFTMERGMLLNTIFIALTLVKAFYIVSEFMHLGHESISLILSVVIPIIFIVWLVVVLLTEGGYIFEAKF